MLHRRLFLNFGRLKDLIARIVRDHQASLDPNSPRDFIDCVLTKIARAFNPEHFLDTILQDEPCLHALPSRWEQETPTVPGRVARMELFLYLTAIRQSFSLGAPENIDLTPLSSRLGNLPRPFQLCVRAR